MSRSCSVEINNKSGCYTLINPRVSICSGCCQIPLPPIVDLRSTGTAMFNKTAGCARGAVGVFTYDLFKSEMNDYSHVMAVMYSAPYDRNIYSPWFAVGIFDKGTNCDYDLYNIMYNGSGDNFVRAKADGSGIAHQGDYVTIRASMSEAHEAVLKVDVSDTDMCQKS